MDESEATRDRYKVWVNPRGFCERPRYMGEIMPSEQGREVSAADLVSVGFPPGSYTVRLVNDPSAGTGVARWKRIDLA
jgi:hypothetical protein